MSIHLVVTLTSDAEFPQQFFDVVRNAVPLSRKDEGCLDYKLAHDIEIPGHSTARKNVYTFIEHWRSVEDLENHLKQPHTKKIFSAIEKFGIKTNVKSYQEHEAKP